MDHIKNSPNMSQNGLSGSSVLIECSDPNQINQYSNWNIDFRQIEPGPLKTRYFLREGKLISLIEANFSCAVHQVGVSPADTITFGIPLSNCVSLWQGIELGPAPILSFGSGDTFDGFSAANFRGLTFNVNCRVLDCFSDQVGISIPNPVRAAGVMVKEDNHIVVDDFVAHSLLLVHSQDAVMTSQVEEFILLDLLRSLTDSTIHEDKSSLPVRTRAVEKALAFMTEYAEENMLISQICMASGTSWRTLDRGFKERFGIGPKEYYKSLRLNRVRTGLINRDPSQSISDVANRWGFWHLGQFASDYKMKFGELPSETTT